MNDSLVFLINTVMVANHLFIYLKQLNNFYLLRLLVSSVNLQGN